MYRLVVLLILFTCFAIPFSLASHYVVDNAIGDVFVRNKGRTVGVEVGYVIKQGDTIMTGRDSECYISIKNGYIKVEQNSSITFEQLDKIAKGFKSDNVKVFGSVILSIGGVFSKDKTLNIKTQTAFATVRGTEFVIDADNRSTVIYVLEGVVSVAPLLPLTEEELIRRAVDVRKGEKIEISEIDVINATTFIKEGNEEGYGIFLNGKKRFLIESEKERFNQRMKTLRELQKKRKEELERKRKEYLKDPSRMFE